eukprot:1269393-Lingulodinium_polyedra.AAC.1
MPDAGLHAGPTAPSTRNRLGASYAEQAGPAAHSGAPARARAARTVQSGTRSNAFFPVQGRPNDEFASGLRGLQLHRQFPRQLSCAA